MKKLNSIEKIIYKKIINESKNFNDGEININILYELYQNNQESKLNDIEPVAFSKDVIKQLIISNYKSFSILDIEQQKDLEILSCLLNNVSEIDKYTHNKKYYYALLTEGFITKKYNVNNFLENYVGVINEEIWGSMLCSNEFVDYLESKNIDPFIKDNDYRKYVREAELKMVLSTNNKKEMKKRKI